MARHPSFGHHWLGYRNSEIPESSMLSEDYGYNRGPPRRIPQPAFGAGRDSFLSPEEAERRLD